MGQRGKYFRAQEGGVLAFYCPGCEETHGIVIDKTRTCHWEFNENYDCPTFAPSVRHFDNEGTICHYFIKAGKIEYCGDCRHSLSGQTVPLPELPPQYRDDYKPEETRMTPEDHQASDAADTSAPQADTKDSDGAKTAAEVHAEAERAEREAAHKAAAEKADDTADHHQDSEAAEAPAPVGDDGGDSSAAAAEKEAAQVLHDLPEAIKRFNEAAEYIHELMPRIVALEEFVHRLTSSTVGDFSFPQLVEEFTALKLKLRHMI